MTKQPDRRGMDLCDALAKARWRLGYDQETAARLLHLPLRDLVNYETGMRRPPASVIEEMADLYGFEAERLVDGEFTATFPPKLDEEANVLWLGWTPIDLKDRSNEHILRSVALVIRSMRGLSEEGALHLRFTDKPMLARLLNLTDPGLPALMATNFKLDADETDSLMKGLEKLERQMAARA